VLVAYMPPLLRDLFDHSTRELGLRVTTIEEDDELADAVVDVDPD
jgi:hypothetical protein